MKTRYIPMSIQEFELMQYPFGWKAEYANGNAIFIPRDLYVSTKVTIEWRSVNKSYPLIPANPDFKSQMISAFFESFQDGVEFCNWSVDAIQEHAENNINNYFNGVRGQPLSVSAIALEPDTENIAGLALFTYDQHGNGGTSLDLLFVRPSHQRKRVATAMVSSAVNQLQKQGIEELYSGFHVCNKDSEKWHHAFGFKDIYDQFYIRLKYAWFRREIWRHEKLGLQDQIEELTRQRDYWHSQLQDGRKFII